MDYSGVYTHSGSLKSVCRRLGADLFQRVYDYLRQARLRQDSEDSVVSALGRLVERPADCFEVDQLIYYEEQLQAAQATQTTPTQATGFQQTVFGVGAVLAPGPGESLSLQIQPDRSDRGQAYSLENCLRTKPVEVERTEGKPWSGKTAEWSALAPVFTGAKNIKGYGINAGRYTAVVNGSAKMAERVDGLRAFELLFQKAARINYWR
ncbi:hypothetical protein NFI96_001696 [Prochilodus magdalenae]|nr:hypothetical protein NFI96_001696 [Prochilodus magdalenae]